MQLCARLLLLVLLAALARQLTRLLLADNRINGDYSCGNNETLATDYKARAGFEGWVMSDWGATHSGAKALSAGLDQEQPGCCHSAARGRARPPCGAACARRRCGCRPSISPR